MEETKACPWDLLCERGDKHQGWCFPRSGRPRDALHRVRVRRSAPSVITRESPLRGATGRQLARIDKNRVRTKLRAPLTPPIPTEPAVIEPAATEPAGIEPAVIEPATLVNVGDSHDTRAQKAKEFLKRAKKEMSAANFVALLNIVIDFKTKHLRVSPAKRTRMLESVYKKTHKLLVKRLHLVSLFVVFTTYLPREITDVRGPLFCSPRRSLHSLPPSATSRSSSSPIPEEG